MITTREARLAAEAWMREEAGRYPELVGAMVAGSTQVRAPEEPHPPSSDVDLFIYVDAQVPPDILEPRGRFAPRKLAFRGVVLEPSFYEARRIADPEAVLGDMYLAPVFTEPCILLDPRGRLEALAAAVKPQFSRRRHAQRRLAQALEFGPPPAPPGSIRDIPALRAACWRNAGHAIGVMRCALATLVATLRYPTIRRSFVIAREVLCAAGRQDLADALLRLLGSLGSLAHRSKRSPPRPSRHTTSPCRCDAPPWSWTGTCRATCGSCSAQLSGSWSIPATTARQCSTFCSCGL